MKILVTGATGFVGRRFCSYLASHHVDYIALGRKKLNTNATENPIVTNYHAVALDKLDEINALMDSVTHIVHLAGRAHQFDAHIQNAQQLYYDANVLTTQTLIQAAISRKAHLIYVSTIKVNGESGHFTADDLAHPQDLYAQSKYQAEQLILKAHQEQGLIYTILRPTLIYGEGAKGNLDKLLKIIDKDFPLPFASVNNARSMIHLDNFCELLRCCTLDSKAQNQLFLAAEPNPFSTPELIKLLAQGLKKSAKLYPVPLLVMQFFAKLTGKTGLLDRITGSLTVDTQALDNIHFKMVIEPTQGLIQMAEYFIANQNKISQ